eukprot:CAMPEP_0198457924 /NCGR_PEP_ID=MMETSP1453-20131121/32694_1 /TAXON_ID=1461543 ORGANISM="Unidentified sp., Strain RCC701" /NCGR_SAMPLE_ID=MMETSP1453 /ASSEMBLY_ACC=CAM_ASM_001118 /LENGTH=94 /DNA_ID=CAMNT_0044182715 /DNA_START=27 /DNA_END=308 /DNA_ORIENTATION=+
MSTESEDRVARVGSEAMEAADELFSWDKSGGVADILEQIDVNVDAIRNEMCDLAVNSVLARAEVLRAKQTAFELNLVEAALSHFLDTAAGEGLG